MTGCDSAYCTCERPEEQGRYELLLQHRTTGRNRPMREYCDEFTAHRVAKWMRDQGFRIIVRDRLAA